MIDLITTKFAMMIAAIVILSTVLGVYALQRDQVTDLELRNIAERISETICEVGSLQGEAELNITFEKGQKGRYIEPVVDGSGYEIMITRYDVIITQEERRFYSSIVGTIHLWEPKANAYNRSEIAIKDEAHNTLESWSGQDFTIKRKFLEISAEDQYMTFVYMR